MVVRLAPLNEKRLQMCEACLLNFLFFVTQISHFGQIKVIHNLITQMNKLNRILISLC